ncbi:hypothetical protein Tco_0279949, partial [Tanacetum coccineum]
CLRTSGASSMRVVRGVSPKQLSEIVAYRRWFYLHSQGHKPYLSGLEKWMPRSVLKKTSMKITFPSPRSARWPIGIAAFGLCLPFLIKNSGSAQESAGNNRKEGVHVAAAPVPPLSQWGSRFGIYYKGDNPLQITTPLLGSRLMENGNSRLMGTAESRVTGTAV